MSSLYFIEKKSGIVSELIESDIKEPEVLMMGLFFQRAERGKPFPFARLIISVYGCLPVS